MMALAAYAPVRNNPAMSPRRVDSATEIKLVGRALGVLRARAAMSQAEAADRLGVTAQAWQHYEAGERQAVLRTDLQDRLTAALGFTRDDLAAEIGRLMGDHLPPAGARPSATVHPFPQGPKPGPYGGSHPPELQLLPIRDTVQAGAWFMADDFRQDQPASHPVARDPRFPHAHQWLSEVRGDSVNLLNIVDGDLVHCVDAVEIGYAPRTGDVVEVERVRFGGQERELTLKQAEVTPEGVLLWPRSTNPRHQTPLELTAGTAEGEDVEVRIRALVVAAIRRL